VSAPLFFFASLAVCVLPILFALWLTRRRP